MRLNKSVKFAITFFSVPIAFSIRYGDLSYLVDPSVLLSSLLGSMLISISILLATSFLSSKTFKFRNEIITLAILFFTPVATYLVYIFLYLEIPPRTIILIAILLSAFLSQSLNYAQILVDSWKTFGIDDGLTVAIIGFEITWLTWLLDRRIKIKKIIQIDVSGKKSRFFSDKFCLIDLDYAEEILATEKLDEIWIPEHCPPYILDYLSIQNTDQNVLRRSSQIESYDNFSKDSRSSINKPVGLNRRDSRYTCDTYFVGKNVLVAGGAGTVGNELCRQLAFSGVKTLVSVDISEFALFSQNLELQRSFAGLEINFAIYLFSLADQDKLKCCIEQHSIDVVFHAAAYKHVGIVQDNRNYAFDNNLQCSLSIVKVLKSYPHIESVLISSDKAVNPTNVMGLSKLASELLFESARLEGLNTRVVRFGNVIDSSGSVIQIFRDQIIGGGPVTVTDRNASRYFMTIPEAVRLVMQSVMLESSSNIFVFEMGDPISILNLAEAMIILHGKVPVVEGDDCSYSNLVKHETIHIRFIGLKDGEKLCEKLSVGELVTTSVSKVNTVRSARCLKSDMSLLETLAIESGLSGSGVLNLTFKEINNE